jgi:hypothetical protein
VSGVGHISEAMIPRVVLFLIVQLTDARTVKVAFCLALLPPADTLLFLNISYTLSASTEVLI